MEVTPWLVCAEAIFHTQMWREHNDTASHGVGHGVYYTASNSRVVYAISMGWPNGNKLALRTPKPSAHTTVEMLGCTKQVTWRPSGQPVVDNASIKHSAERAYSLDPAQAAGMVLSVPPLTPPELPTATGPWVFKLTAVD
jgi:hypothetical protein